MEVALSPAATAFSFSTNSKFSIKLPKTTIQTCSLFPIAYKLNSKKKNSDKHSSAISFSFNSDNLLVLPPHPSSISTISSFKRTRAASTSRASTFFTSSFAAGVQNRYWMVVMETPPQDVNSKPQIVDYYVKTLQRVLGSEEEAQMCIYDASCDTHFGFCCDIDEEASRELARSPGVLSVMPDPDFSSTEKNYSNSKVQLGPLSNTLFGGAPLFPSGNSKHWLVQMEKPAIGVVTKAQMVDHYTQVLTKVMGNEKDAQMCIYHISWQSNFGFCCELDEECAKELAGLPVVLSVQPDKNFESLNKEYGGEKLQLFGGSPVSSAANEVTNIKTKKLFVTGLSFYTSEKTLRAAFEGFGELTEVKIIMDKISKRSKGYAFVEYTTEAAAAAALKEMNGKIINGWMITVDIAKSKPPKYSSGRPRPAL